MWRPPYERSLPPPPPRGRQLPPMPPHRHRAPPARPRPPHGPIRGYVNEGPPYPREVHAHHHEDSYQPSPSIYRSAPPPPRRYEYSYGAPPPSYPPRFRAAPPPGPPRPYYGEASLREEMPSSMSPSAALPIAGGGCTCKKSKCLKLYCQCFSASTTCGPKCKCQSCHNTTMHRDDIENARKIILERNPQAFDIRHYPTNPSALSPPNSPSKQGCKCRRSFCLKKYCECFNHGMKCNGECRCVNCRNQANPGTPGPGSAGPYVQAQKPSPTPRLVSDADTMAAPILSEPALRTPTQAPPAESRSPPSTIVSTSTVDVNSTEKAPQDRMAIMAAVAMTELLGGGKRSRSPESVTQVVSQSQSEDSLEPTEKKMRMEVQSDHHNVVSSSSSSPETIRSLSRYSPSGSPLHFTPYPGNYFTPFSPCPKVYHPKAYEETTRLSGLPKSLSFRKICSKCGKTRGEHGELGFGHRCVYQECGKCGAGVQMHVKFGVPMGILCSLTEKDGAVPGRTRAYERKIKDLATRAELQQKLQQQRAVQVAQV